eukprot:TRINITY_DN11119_c0_g1_i1.p1 TRINITY_DN11119_c0_g1~~TRINITY_DN11119_c0_g1_i1.p1  ORF type:complete len:224 (-),score=60.96 TRINITY_DN11119_c0_g1_i1:27-698(-)
MNNAIPVDKIWEHLYIYYDYSEDGQLQKTDILDPLLGQNGTNDSKSRTFTSVLMQIVMPVLFPHDKVIEICKSKRADVFPLVEVSDEVKAERRENPRTFPSEERRKILDMMKKELLQRRDSNPSLGLLRSSSLGSFPYSSAPIISPKKRPREDDVEPKARKLMRTESDFVQRVASIESETQMMRNELDERLKSIEEKQSKLDKKLTDLSVSIDKIIGILSDNE